MEAHLGEVIGSVEPPMRAPKVRHRNPRWIEDGTSMVIAVVATAMFVPLCVLGLWIAFAFSGKP